MLYLNVSFFEIIFLYLISFHQSMPKEKSCGAVVFIQHKEGIRYLLLHYEAGHWDFPKGHMGKNEKEEMTAAREIKEETGIKSIDFVDGFREVITYFYKRGEETIHKEVIFFLAQSATEEVTISKEHIGHVWMSYENAFKKLTFNTAKELLRKANQFLYKSAKSQ